MTYSHDQELELHTPKLFCILKTSTNYRGNQIDSPLVPNDIAMSNKEIDGR